MEDKIPQEKLQVIIEAGLYAPSENNEQSWHFTVVRDKELLDKLSNDPKEVAKSFNDKLIQYIE